MSSMFKRWGRSSSKREELAMGRFPEAELSAFAAGHNEFAVGLYRARRSEKGNLFFSPYSIRAALAMASAGARGRTALQMAQVLYLSEADPHLHAALRAFDEALAARRSEGAIEIDVANALWRQSGLPLVKEFLDTMASAYRSASLEADFAGAPEKACAAINRWVADKTHEKIRHLLDPKDMDPWTLLILANAIYFNGKWVSPFPERMTQPEDFVTEPEGSGKQKKTSVPMMRQQFAFGYAEDDDVQVLEMPYAGEKLSMVFFLPKTRNGRHAFEDKISARVIAQWIHRLRRQQVHAFIPKFQFMRSGDFAPTLSAMGMVDAFSEPTADFSGIALIKPLYITKVIHGAGVEVDEQGTEAHAATIVEIARCFGPSPYSPPVFRADHPFIFLIRDVPLDAILFMGRVLNPMA